MQVLAADFHIAGNLIKFGYTRKGVDMTDPPNLFGLPASAKVTRGLCGAVLIITFATSCPASAATLTNNYWNTLVCEEVLPPTPLGEVQALASRKLAAPQPKFDDRIRHQLPAMHDCT